VNDGNGNGNERKHIDSVSVLGSEGAFLFLGRKSGKGGSVITICDLLGRTWIFMKS
jgi:hypothetical protein